MKAQHLFGLNLSWRRATTVFLIDVAVLALAGSWPPDDLPSATYAWWSGVGVAALITVTALVTCRRVPLSAALSALVVDRLVDPEAVLTWGCTPAVDHHRRYGRDPVAVREYQGRLVSVIAVGAREGTPSGRHHVGTAPTALLPVDLVATALRQFDVVLDGIDIVSAGTASGVDPGIVETEDHRETDGWHSAIEHRDTWLVLRMDPQRNVAAVATRDSLASTLAAATERLVHDLDGRQISARALTAGEFADAETAVLAGLEPTQVRIRWRYLKQKETTAQATSFWVSPQDITSENLEQLWLVHSDAAVVTVRLAPRHGRTEVSVLVRYHSPDRLAKDECTGLNRLVGRQLAAVRASLPMPTRDFGPGLPARELSDDEHLTVPVDPAPQLPAVRAGAQP